MSCGQVRQIVYLLSWKVVSKGEPGTSMGPRHGGMGAATTEVWLSLHR